MRCGLILLSFFFFSFPILAQDQNHKIKSTFSRIEKRSSSEANIIIEWELTTQCKSQEINASLYQSSNLATGVGPAPLNPSLLKPEPLNAEKTKFKITLPFGRSKTLDSDVYSILRYGITVEFESGITYSAPLSDIDLNNIKLTIRDEVAPIVLRPVDFNLLGVTLLDTKISLKVSISRPCTVRISALQGGKTIPNSSTPRYENYLQGEQEITLSPVAPSTQYTILCEAIDRNRTPEEIISTKSFVEFNGLPIITKSNISRAQVQFLENPIATPKGIKVKVRVKSTFSISFNLFKRVSGNSGLVLLVSGNTDRGFDKNSGDFTQGDLFIPFSGAVKLPDEEFYISLKAEQSPGYGSEYGEETDKRIISCYPQKLAEAFVMTFSGKELNISAESIDGLAIKLAAEWLTPNGPSPLRTRNFTPIASIKPSVPIPYLSTSSLPPVLLLTIRDEIHDVTEEARVQLKVDTKHYNADGTEDAGKSFNNKIFTDQINKDRDGKTNDPKFRWSELARSGIGAVLRYLVGIF